MQTKSKLLGALASLLACAHATQNPGAADPERRLISIKAEVMSADYRADLAALGRLREAALALADAPAVGYLARYWAAYSSWRIAINGASRGMKSPDLRAHLEQALSGFEACIQQRSDFADASAAASSVTGWLATWEKGGTPAMMARFARSRKLLTRARELAPENPRVLWVLGGVYLFSPAGHGGDKNRAIEIYQRMAEVARAAGRSDSPLPDWGLPEAHMSLAYARLQSSPPQPDAAAGEAREALRLEPDWSYVRDILMPQIEVARSAK
jgi:tetratricopeptide (TPR) repeat protein